MRVLAVTPYLPAPPDFGGASRIYHLLRELQERCELTVFSLAATGDDPEPSAAVFENLVTARVPLTARSPAGPRKRRKQLFSALSKRSFQHRFYWNRSAQAKLTRLLQQDIFDIVQIEFSQMAVYATPGVRHRVIDLHNIEHEILRQAAGGGSVSKRLFNALEWRKFRSEEQRYWHGADLCLATSRVDADHVSRVTGEPCTVIPNGVDDAFHTRAPLSEAVDKSIVFTGAMRYQPNADAAVHFVRRVWPLIRDLEPDATFNIVGADPPEDVVRLGEREGVTVTGTVEDVRPWLRAASAVVVPLLSGSGTRLKILEAFATGRPVVSTTIGASGLDVADNEHALIANRPADMAQGLVSLIRNRTLAQRISDNAYQLIQAKYRWGIIGEALFIRYEQLLAP